MTGPNPQPATSGLGQVLAIVQAVVALVPRWLVVAAGVIFLTWLGFEMYMNARAKFAQTPQIEVESAAKTRHFQAFKPSEE